MSALVLGFLVAPAYSSSPAQAYDADAFNPGNIIDDALFYDGGALSAAQVQNFLNQQVPRCTLGDAGRIPGTPWGSTVLASSCLKDFRSTTASRVANAYCGAYAGAVNETAAQIIAKVGAACGISQKVLLVMLDKEQSLVTDSWPTQRQFDVAMGYACPDSGPGGTANCDPTQTGFFQQVYRAAWQLRVYRAHSESYGYRPGWNSINWQVVERGCGTSQVYIENWATAALYIYTPYRPNDAALAAGWGTGDYCSTYGNRNFANYYRSWFGPLHVTPQVLGDLNEALPAAGGISVRGWAGDPKNPGVPQNVQFYVGNAGYMVAAGQQRPDVAAAYPALGAATGYVDVLQGNWLGKQRVCAYATVQLGCQTVDFGVAGPTGDLNSAVIVNGQLVVTGWGVDADRLGSPLAVHVYVGGQSFATPANVYRQDVANAYPAYGTNRGFLWSMDAAQWAGTTQQVCAYGINVAPDGAVFGTHPRLGNCQSVVFPQSLGNRPPVGAIEQAEVIDDQLVVSGWALDPDTTASLDVHVYVGAAGYRARADQARPDIAAAYQRPDGAYGFTWTMPIDSSWDNPAEVCVYAINVTSNSVVADPHPKLGCAAVSWIAGIRAQHP